MNFRDFCVQCVGKLIPDKMWLQIKFHKWFGRSVDFKNPKTFNEKIQWLKLYDHNPKHIVMADKYRAKIALADIIGEQFIIPTLGVWDKFDEINFDELPDQFVLKTTHDCGGVVICQDKSTFDKKKAKKFLTQHLKRNYYLTAREWPYKHIKPRIIAEKFMIDESGKELKDYKVFNFAGEPYCIQVDFDRFIEHKKNLYDTDWNLLDFSFNYPSHPEIEIKRPDNLEEMLELSRKIAKDEIFVRTDFYSINGKTYVGEITYYPASGYGKFTPEKYDLMLGDMIKIPTDNKGEKQDNK